MTKICVMCSRRTDKPAKMTTCKTCGVERCDHRRCDCPAEPAPRPMKSRKDATYRPVVLRCGCSSDVEAIQVNGTTEVHARRSCAGCGTAYQVELRLTSWETRGKERLPVYAVRHIEPV